MYKFADEMRIYSVTTPTAANMAATVTVRRGILKFVLSATAAITLTDGVLATAIVLAANQRHEFQTRNIEDFNLTCAANVLIEVYLENQRDIH